MASADNSSDTTLSVENRPVLTSPEHGSDDTLSSEKKISTVTKSDEVVSKTPDALRAESGEIDESSYLTGWRLYLAFTSLCLGLIFSQMDITIVGTALLSITNELNDFSKSTWIVTAYLVAYTSFLIPIAKMSDIYGRLPVLVFSVVSFVAFSAGCAASRSMTELAVFRALQGIGAGGLFDLAFAMLPQLVPPEKLINWSPLVSGSFLVSATLGPIIGGVITDHTTWRWIFWINLPAGAIIFILSCLTIPLKFPHHNKRTPPKIGLHSLRRIDYVGNILVLAATTLLICGLEVGGTQFDWNNAVPLSLLIIGIICWALCIYWQYFQSKRTTLQEPVLPWRVLTDRVAMGLILNSFFVGTTLLTLTINLPIRFQLVDGCSPLDAGIRLIALMALSAVGNILGAQLVRRTKLTPHSILQIGSVIQTVGVAVYTAVDAGRVGLHPSVYGFEAIIGFGMGISLASTTVLVPKLFHPRDIAVIMGARGQFRLLGGAIAISGCANILNRTIKQDLAGLLTPQQLSSILSDTTAAADLSGDVYDALIDSFTKGFRQQMILITVLSALTIVANMLVIRPKPKPKPTAAKPAAAKP